jgi:hypothetical protein
MNDKDRISIMIQKKQLILLRKRKKLIGIPISTQIESALEMYFNYLQSQEPQTTKGVG